jgi:hypothetical protein
MVYSFAPLSGNQQHVEERLRTLSLCVCALAAVVGTLYVLRSVLVPFVLAVAMRYLLQPLVITLTQRPLHCGAGVVLCSQEPCGPSRPRWLRSLGALLCHLQLPHWLAVVVTLAVAFTALGVFGVVIADSVRLFAARADTYAAQVRRLCAGVLGWLDTSAGGAEAESPIQQLYQRLTELASRLPLSQLILNSVEVVLALFSNLFLVLLFTVYLLLGRYEDEDPSDEPGDDVSVGSQIDDQITLFIKGKARPRLQPSPHTLAHRRVDQTPFGHRPTMYCGPPRVRRCCCRCSWARSPASSWPCSASTCGSSSARSPSGSTLCPTWARASPRCCRCPSSASTPTSRRSTRSSPSCCPRRCT